MSKCFVVQSSALAQYGVWGAKYIDILTQMVSVDEFYDFVVDYKQDPRVYPFYQAIMEVNMLHNSVKHIVDHGGIASMPERFELSLDIDKKMLKNPIVQKLREKLLQLYPIIKLV